MGFRRRLLGGYAAPVVALLGILCLLAWLLPLPGFVAVKLLTAAAAAGFVRLLWQRTLRTNQAIARFLAAVRQGDLSQTFRNAGGTGFDELGEALDAALQRLRAERLASASENRFAAALIDEAPTALLAISPDGEVQLANKAARRLFREGDRRHAGEFSRYGDAFADALATLAPGARRVCRVLWNELPHRAVLVAATVERQSRLWRIVSVQIIQAELDHAEIATQTDLVRVLTHEIMNAITPVTSLAASASSLIAQADAGDASAIPDARLAVETLARRAASISRFVESYRAFSQTPTIAARRFDARGWAQDILRTFAAMPAGDGVTISLSIAPEPVAIVADPDLLGQALLNLVKNAGEAARDHALAPAISVEIGRSGAGRTRLRIVDNGPGIPATIADEIFLPFYTTKAAGTGVGLSFARQIVLLHGGVIGVAAAADGGAAFEISL